MKVQVVVPVYNEERRLARSLPVLHTYLTRRLPWAWEVVIAENGSTDRTPEVAAELAAKYEGVRVVRLPEPGRGRALKAVWSEAEAEVVSYMDVDLATDLEAFARLIEPLAAGTHEVAIGSRLMPGAQVARGWKREVCSRVYNRLVRLLLGTRFSDAQCGFKALRREAAQALLARVEDTGWFFDTELLVWAERLGYRIFELPVRWADDPDSRVRLLPTIAADLRGLWRLRRRLGCVGR